MRAGSFACSCLVFPLKAGFLIISFTEEMVFLARKCGRGAGRSAGRLGCGLQV